MEIESLLYFSELCIDLNMTKTAERLFVSQQTLSNHIMRLENEYKTKFFYRKPKLKLTPTGEIFLEYSKRILSIEKNIKNKITDIEGENKGELIIGASSPRCNTYLPDILIEFSKKYPLIKINLIDKYSVELEELVAKNEIDFAICVEQKTNNKDIIVEKLLDDKIYFLVSEKLLESYYKKEKDLKKKKAFSGINVEEIKELPLLMISNNNRMGKIINNCFNKKNIVPNSYLNVKYTSMLVPICNNSLAAGFTSQMNLNYWYKQFNNTVNIFPFFDGKEQVKLSVDLLRNKNRYLPKYVLYFIEILKKYFKVIEDKKLERKI